MNIQGAQRSSGFTLVELLLATTLGALLLLATASASGVFGRQMSALHGEQSNELGHALATVSDAVRYAWWAALPTNRRVVVADPLGRETLFQFDGGQMLVTRPDGSSGVIASGIFGATFTAETETRYREAAPVLRNGDLHSGSAPFAVLPTTLMIENDDALALGFTAGSVAPVGGHAVPGVTEQLVSANLQTLSIAVSGVPPKSGVLTVNLHRARAPNDARPLGPSLGQVSVNVTSLPATATHFIDSLTGLVIIPPGGVAWGWWKLHPYVVSTFSAPTVQVALDLAPLAAVVQPGQAYTLVLRQVGTGGIAFATYPAASAKGSGVARAVGGGAFTEQPLTVARTLSAALTLTRTTATAVVSRVHMALTGSDGQELSGSATVIGQTMVESPWLGVVPGETQP